MEMEKNIHEKKKEVNVNMHIFEAVNGQFADSN